MDKAAHFQVDPRLAELLGENYRSTERALKELVDNAWDADADNVWITLPERVLAEQPIIVKDDGTGMTEKEVRTEYLKIANARLSRKGLITPDKHRRVKGRKGIGKFAGLVAADVMALRTSARGILTQLRVVKKDILGTKLDLERIDLPITTSECPGHDHGTTVTLSQLNQARRLPVSPRMKEILVAEYGRERDFRIYVNGEAITSVDIPGRTYEHHTRMPVAGEIRLTFTITESPKGVKNAGIVCRVQGKIVGKSSFFGLEEREDIPGKLLRRVVGEIEADGLEADVTADWGAFIENSKAYQDVHRWARVRLNEAVEETFKTYINLAKARRKKEIKERLKNLPEYRREFANEGLERVLRRFYGESEDKIDVLVSLMLDSFEMDEYWQVCRKIEDARQADVLTLAEVLGEFGIADMALMAKQASLRLRFLNDLERLARSPETEEWIMHKAIETNLWILGPEYCLMASNKTLARTIEDYLGKKFTGERAKKRPDLFLAQSIHNKHLVIEFKRPSHTAGRDDENQAEKYRDDFAGYFQNPIEILIFSGEIDTKMVAHYQRDDVRLLSYRAAIAEARMQLEWLLDELADEKPMRRTEAKRPTIMPSGFPAAGGEEEGGRATA